jgi:putative flippase GtrA
VIGVYNTAFGYFVFAATYLLLRRRLHYLAILVVAHVLAVSNAFLGHKYLTFKVRGHLLKDYLRFNVAYLGALAIGLIGLPFLVEICHLHPLASQAILSTITVLSSYLLHKHLSFRRA